MILHFQGFLFLQSSRNVSLFHKPCQHFFQGCFLTTNEKMIKLWFNNNKITNKLKIKPDKHSYHFCY